MTETVGEWQARKQAQADRFIRRYPTLKLERWQDYGTCFVLIAGDPKLGAVDAITIGQLAREEIGQPLVDRSDEWVETFFIPTMAG